MVQFRDYELGLADFAIQMFNAGGGSATHLLISVNTNVTLSLEMTINMNTVSMSQHALYEYVSLHFDVVRVHRIGYDVVGLCSRDDYSCHPVVITDLLDSILPRDPFY